VAGSGSTEDDDEFLRAGGVGVPSAVVVDCVERHDEVEVQRAEASHGLGGEPRAAARSNGRPEAIDVDVASLIAELVELTDEIRSVCA
jgi:hypothetical protein